MDQNEYIAAKMAEGPDDSDYEGGAVEMIGSNATVHADFFVEGI